MNATTGGAASLFASGEGLTNALDFVFVPSSTDVVFGYHAPNTYSPPITVTVTNTGTAPLALSSVTITGSTYFSETSTCGASISPGGFCNSLVIFDPSSSGARSATLTLTDNSGGISGATQSIALTGTGGLAPAAATPVFTSAAGTYTTPQAVTIGDATAGATLYYTTKGTLPTTASTLYTGAIKVNATETIEAIAVALGYANSTLATATFTIAPLAATPVFSLAGGTYTGPQTLTLTDASAGASICLHDKLNRADRSVHPIHLPDQRLSISYG